MSYIVCLTFSSFCYISRLLSAQLCENRLLVQIKCQLVNYSILTEVLQKYSQTSLTENEFGVK